MTRWRPVIQTTVVVLCLLLGYGIFHILRDPEILPIKSVVVQGEYQHVDREYLRSLIMPLVDRGFFEVNVHAVKSRVKAMPWVAEAVVRRVWPDKILVKITEQKPVARWNDHDLFNAQGDLFAPHEPHFPKGLPWLRGPHGYADRVFVNYQKMSTLLASSKLAIRQLTLSEQHDWSMVLENGIAVTIGQSQVYARLKRFIKIYPQLTAHMNVDGAKIDLRYTNGVAVRADKEGV